MSDGEKTAMKGPIPAYVSFTSLTNFLRALGKKGLPSQIDKSVMTNLSGGMQAQVTSALKFLHLVDSQNAPTEWMKSLAVGDDDEQKQTWKSIVESRYKFLFDKLKMSTATTSQVAAELATKGATGDTSAKCISFLLAASKQAGIDISTHIKPTRSKKTTTRAEKKATAAEEKPTKKTEGSRPAGEDGTSKQDVLQILLEKFPTFDPGWSPELKASWFSAYEELMKRSK